MSEALTHDAPLQNCIVVWELAEASVAQTVTIPVVMPVRWTSRRTDDVRGLDETPWSTALRFLTTAPTWVESGAPVPVTCNETPVVPRLLIVASPPLIVDVEEAVLVVLEDGGGVTDRETGEEELLAKDAVTETIPVVTPTTSTEQEPVERVHWLDERNALLLLAWNVTDPGSGGVTVTVQETELPTLTEADVQVSPTVTAGSAVAPTDTDGEVLVRKFESPE
jgi:hypothetical protein